MSSPNTSVTRHKTTFSRNSINNRLAIVLSKLEIQGDKVYTIGTPYAADKCINTAKGFADYSGTKYGKSIKTLVKYGKKKVFVELESIATDINDGKKCVTPDEMENY